MYNIPDSSYGVLILTFSRTLGYFAMLLCLKRGEEIYSYIQYLCCSMIFWSTKSSLHSFTALLDKSISIFPFFMEHFLTKDSLFILRISDTPTNSFTPTLKSKREVPLFFLVVLFRGLRNRLLPNYISSSPISRELPPSPSAFPLQTILFQDVLHDRFLLRPLRALGSSAGRNSLWPRCNQWTQRRLLEQDQNWYQQH